MNPALIPNFMKSSGNVEMPVAAHKQSRRDFVKRIAVAGAGALAMPEKALSQSRNATTAKCLNIAGIGLGARGAVLLRDHFNTQNIVALCDVDAKKAASTFARFSGARRYTDFRIMLEEEKSIDAVMIATPDHLHAVVAMAAMKLGKHVYCEKPLTHSVWEARQLADAAKRESVATQMGNTGQASEGTRLLCELVWAGAIGPVRKVEVWTDRPMNGLFKEYWPQGIERPTQDVPVPATLDWDLWLGPAPFRPYSPAYVPHDWRGWCDFGTGALGDMGCHRLDPIFRALKLGYPNSVQATSTQVNSETYPKASIVTFQFPARGQMPPVELIWYDGGLRPPRPECLDQGTQFGVNGHLLTGENGLILNHRIIPEAKAVEFGQPPKVLKRSPGHYEEWLSACRGGAAPGSNFGWAGPLTEAVLLGNIALRPELREGQLLEPLEWDGAEMRFTNVPEANQFLRKPYRDGWAL